MRFKWATKSVRVSSSFTCIRLKDDRPNETMRPFLLERIKISKTDKPVSLCNRLCGFSSIFFLDRS